MKLAKEPWQIVLVLVAIETLGVTMFVTVNINALLVAVCPFTQLALLVTTHVTISPCVNEEVL